MLRSDNGPCYSSREFHNFLNFYQVDHITSSPHYPQSNGFTEALVGIAKKLMDKSLKEGKPWNFGLLQYRTTPISSTLPSPLEILTGRKPRLNLPQVPSSIGHNMDTSRIRKEMLRRQPTMSTSTGAHRIGTWTTSVCQGSAWKRLENGNRQSTSCRTRFLLGQVSRQLHLEKDQVNDQTKVSTFSS